MTDEQAKMFDELIEVQIQIATLNMQVTKNEEYLNRLDFEYARKYDALVLKMTAECIDETVLSARLRSECSELEEMRSKASSRHAELDREYGLLRARHQVLFHRFKFSQ